MKSLGKKVLQELRLNYETPSKPSSSVGLVFRVGAPSRWATTTIEIVGFFFLYSISMATAASLSLSFSLSRFLSLSLVDLGESRFVEQRIRSSQNAKLARSSSYNSFFVLLNGLSYWHQN